jgi:hypothetical protein
MNHEEHGEQQKNIRPKDGLEIAAAEPNRDSR